MPETDVHPAEDAARRRPPSFSSRLKTHHYEPGILEPRVAVLPLLQLLHDDSFGFRFLRLRPLLAIMLRPQPLAHSSQQLLPKRLLPQAPTVPDRLELPALSVPLSIPSYLTLCHYQEPTPLSILTLCHYQEPTPLRPLYRLSRTDPFTTPLSIIKNRPLYDPFIDFNSVPLSRTDPFTTPLSIIKNRPLYDPFIDYQEPTPLSTPLWPTGA